jgi:hypothetical protein
MGCVGLVDQHIGRLQVPVQRTLPMGVVNRLGNHLDVPGSLLQRQGGVANHFPQVLARNVIHGEVAVNLVLTDFMDSYDIRMLEVGGCFRFPAKTFSLCRRSQ